MGKILICSGEERIRETIKLILEDHCDLILTESLEECFAVLKNTKIRLLLMDVSDQAKPADSIQKIKSKYPNLKIIILGLRKTNQTLEKALKEYSNGLLQQPFKYEEVLEVCK